MAAGWSNLWKKLGALILTFIMVFYESFFKNMKVKVKFEYASLRHIRVSWTRH